MKKQTGAGLMSAYQSVKKAVSGINDKLKTLKPLSKIDGYFGTAARTSALSSLPGGQYANKAFDFGKDQLGYKKKRAMRSVRK